MYDINMRCVFKVTRGETTKRGSLYNLYLMFNALKTEIKDVSKKTTTNIYIFSDTSMPQLKFIVIFTEIRR